MSRLHLPIQNPCHEDWSAMASDGAARRFCDVCTKHVHDLSAMTEPVARAVVADEAAKGRFCVRYTVDPAGQIQFARETVEAPNLWRMTLAAAGLAMALLTGCTDSKPDQVNRDECVYEVGPWTVTAARGQGTCPAAEPELELVGELVVDVPGQVEVPCEPVVEPIHERKGDIAPERVPVELKGKPTLEPPVQPNTSMMGGIGMEAALDVDAPGN